LIIEGSGSESGSATLLKTLQFSAKEGSKYWMSL
jgi:hypothetical protein